MWAVMAVAEPPIGVVELRRADAEVEQSARDVLDADAANGVGDAVETGVAKGHPLAMGCEPGAGRSERHLVPVETEDRDLVASGEKGFGVTAATERGVDDHTGGNVSENRNDLVEHDRGVFELAVRGGLFRR